ncbi:MAG TPA: threonine/serine exporter family protein [Candidatus Limiplasma sp.]|nr:threonine/serine exporter family protein [Candidatus Limiplasma sp.]
MSFVQAWVVPILCAALGTLGFSVLFHVGKKHLFFSTLGGAVAWAGYLAFFACIGNLYISYTLASVVAAIYAHLMARVFKTPATLFALPATIPMIPGEAFFETMQFAVLGDWANFAAMGVRTLGMAAAIAIGLIVGGMADRLQFYLINARRQKRNGI